MQFSHSASVTSSGSSGFLAVLEAVIQATVLPCPLGFTILFFAIDSASGSFRLPLGEKKKNRQQKIEWVRSCPTTKDLTESQR